MTVFVKEQPVNKPVPVPVEPPVIPYEAPGSRQPAPAAEGFGESSIHPAKEQVAKAPIPTRLLPETEDQPGPTDSRALQTFADPRGTPALEPTPETIHPALVEEAPKYQSADTLPKQINAFQATVSYERPAMRPQAPLPDATQQNGPPQTLEQETQILSTQSKPQTPVDQTVAQAPRPVVEPQTLVLSPGTHQPMVADGSHQDPPGEPSALPEIKNHLAQQPAQAAPTRESQTQPNPWPALGRVQAEISAGPLATGRVLTHPLTSKTDAYPVNAPAETVFPSETAKLPQTDIPMNEMPKPAPVQTPQASLEKLVGEEFAEKAAPQLASAPVEGLETKAGVRKADKGSPKAADPPKIENIPRGDVGLNPNLTRVEVPLPVSEPARLAEAQATRIINQLQDNILRASQAGHTSLHLQLHPEELGRIDLELTSQADGLRITFTPDNPETSKLLACHLKELQQSLTEAGVQISGLSIGQDQAKGAPRHDTWREGKSRGTPTAQTGDELKISSDNVADAGPTGWSSAVNYQI
jgi:flagellar hook-length control protein FliK